jgi:hypothetical protein
VSESSKLSPAVTRLWTEPGLRKRADLMFDLLADVDRNNVSNLVSQLATLNEFWLIMRLLDAVDYGAPATAATTSRPEAHAKIRNLARLGEAVLNVDTHDFESWCQDAQIPKHIRDDLALRIWPMQRQENSVGALHTLIPTFELLLEVFEIRILKGDISMGLSIIHLMTEYLPLLGWEKELGHAGNPKQLAEHLSQPNAMWQSDACPLNRQQRKAFANVITANDSQRHWNIYLRDNHSRVAASLSICAGVPNPASDVSGQRTCRTPCSIRKGNTDLAWAMVLVRRLKESSLLTLRHDAPVGHFFSVPQEPEILESWETTWQGLTADRDEAPQAQNPLRNVVRTGALAGLPELLGVVAGVEGAMQPSNLVSKIVAEIKVLAATA